MKELFLGFVNVGINAGYLILAVLLLRLFMKKAPKRILCLLWALVGIRLSMPASFKSDFSLLPGARTVTTEGILDAYTPEIHSGIDAINNTVNPILEKTLSPEGTYGYDPIVILTTVLGIVWLLGIGALLLYAVVSTLKVRSSVKEAVPFFRNIYLCDAVKTPFILGFFRPRIYLPSAMAEKDRESVLAHENAHIARGDCIWKPLGFLFLTLYWFQPLCWIAYILLCRDIEFACDEKVLSKLGRSEVADYSDALLACSMPRKALTACPLAFGEVGVKARIQSALTYKKPAVWISAVCLLLVVSVAVGFLTDPRYEDSLYYRVEYAFEDAVYTYCGTGDEEAFATCGYRILGAEENDGITTVYGKVYYGEYKESDNKIVETHSSSFPAVGVFRTVNRYGYDEIETLSFETVAANGNFEEKIAELFPKRLQRKAISDDTYPSLAAACLSDARQYYGYENEAINGTKYWKNEDGTYTTSTGYTYLYHQVVYNGDNRNDWFSILTNDTSVTYQRLQEAIFTSDSSRFLDVRETFMIDFGISTASRTPVLTVVTDSMTVSASAGTRYVSVTTSEGYGRGICVDCIPFDDERASTPTVTASQANNKIILRFVNDVPTEISVSVKNGDDFDKIDCAADGSFAMQAGIHLYTVYAEFKSGSYVYYGFFGELTN